MCRRCDPGGEGQAEAAGLRAVGPGVFSVDGHHGARDGDLARWGAHAALHAPGARVVRLVAEEGGVRAVEALARSRFRRCARVGGVIRRQVGPEEAAAGEGEGKEGGEPGTHGRP